jgi:hypothetical protein
MTGTKFHKISLLLLKCEILYIFYRGLGSYLIAPSLDLPIWKFMFRFIYDNIQYIILSIILINVLMGIIIVRYIYITYIRIIIFKINHFL